MATRVKASVRRTKSGRVARVKPHIRHTKRKRQGPTKASLAKSLGPLSRKPYVGLRGSAATIQRMSPGTTVNSFMVKIPVAGPLRQYERRRFVNPTPDRWKDAWVVDEYERVSGRKAKLGKMRELRRS